MNAGVVADGYKRLTESKEFKLAKAAKWDTIRSQYEAELQAADFWGRWRIRLRMRSEFRREIRRMAPPDALYLWSRARKRTKSASE